MTCCCPSISHRKQRSISSVIASRCRAGVHWQFQVQTVSFRGAALGAVWSSLRSASLCSSHGSHWKSYVVRCRLRRVGSPDALWAVWQRCVRMCGPRGSFRREWVPVRRGALERVLVFWRSGGLVTMVLSGA